MKLTVVILAAGLGTRMKSGAPKVLHPLAEKPMLAHVLDAVAGTEPERTILVLGHQADRVREAVQEYGAEVVLQEEQRGTGHAVRQAAAAIAAASGPVMVLCGDTPLIRTETLVRLAETHQRNRAAVTLMTMTAENPFGYGRIVRNRNGVTRIVEEKDATSAQKKMREVNVGIYCFDKRFLLAAIGSIGTNNAQGEYYLPDTVALARKKRLRVADIRCDDPQEAMGINSRIDLSEAERILRNRTNAHWMREGVTMTDPDSVFIGSSVTIGRDTVLYSGVRLEGTTAVGEGCSVLAGSRISNSTIGNGVTIRDHCVIEDSIVGDAAMVGPFAHLRPGSVLRSRSRVGNFVEIKKSEIGEGSKANHLAYIGDAVVGRDVNIGAGVITCNYDGFEKFPTVIEDGVFVGSDSQLVAPVKIGKGALVAAGATITHDVPPDALAISRANQEIKEGFAARRRRMKQKKT